MEDEYLKGLDKDVERLMELHKLSNQEFDKQVVYLAGGGLALTLTFVKDISSVTARQWLPVLLFAWVMFAITLILNLLSHKASYRNFGLMLERLQYYKDSYLKKEPVDQNKVDSYSKRVNRKATWLQYLNMACVICSLIGVFSFIAFASLNFIFPTMPNESTPYSTKPGPGADQVRGLEATGNFITPPLPPTPAAPPQAPQTQAKPSK
ncbi:hypothetical protein [Hymenobacter crusticola]|uniref:Uncharacterized protein n=1 Tax=Hymenobacter crusticola TaxID=1770526 RepID=A0A243W5Q3_9BACT|nr:hypothetical protein [Hymenobacter crusticola]OUJ68983.1 hypothetical protein BXP70_27140 [Hymenobacter crusticola]